MWIFLNDAYLSIVEPAIHDRRIHGSDVLLVRSRFPGDLERTFPGYAVVEGAGTDYRFRCFVPRAEVATKLAEAVTAIDYGNFKGSVREKWRHDTYMGCWSVLMREQERQASRRRPKRQSSLGVGR